MQIEVSDYQESWLRLSEEQQRMVCNRFKISFTNSLDNLLISQIATKQQQEYDNLKLRNEYLRESNSVMRLTYSP